MKKNLTIVMLMMFLVSINLLFANNEFMQQRKEMQKFRSNMSKLLKLHNQTRNSATVIAHYDTYNPYQEEWVEFGKIITEYNPESNLLEHQTLCIKISNEETTISYPWIRNSWIYEEGLVIYSVFQFATYPNEQDPESVVWFPIMATKCTYDNGKIASTITGDIVGFNGDDYEIEIEDENIFYYENNKIVMIATREFDGEDSWFYEREHIYYQNDRIYEMITEGSTDSLDFYTGNKKVFIYNTNDNSSYQEVQNFFNNITLELDYMSYNFSGILLDRIDGYYYMGDDEFSYDSRTLFTFNNYNDILEIKEQFYWDEWVDNSQEIYEYDNNNRLMEVNRFFNDFNNNLVPESRYRFEDTTPVNDITISVPQLKIDSYPNPFVNNLKISAKDNTTDLNYIQVFNIKGQLVKEYNLLDSPKKNFTVELNNQPAGIYLLNIKTSHGNTAKKVLKIK